ncbi:MAG: sulfurtransferase TusA family protein [Bacillota bacterium]
MSALTDYRAAHTVDARGLACPMPIIRARKGMDAIQVGEVLEVLATDRGAPADFRNWCQQTDQKFLELIQEDGYFRMLIKKVVPETREKGRVYPHEISNAALAEALAAGSAPLIIDVREELEYQAGHIPGAMHIPIDQIEQGIAGLDPAREMAVICRTGRRSDYACQIMARNGCSRVKNVVPGMSEWTGPLEK